MNELLMDSRECAIRSSPIRIQHPERLREPEGVELPHPTLRRTIRRQVATAFQVTGEFFLIGILRYRMSLAESHAAKRIEEQGLINEGKNVYKVSAPAVLLHQRREYSAGRWRSRRKPLRESADATTWISMKTLRPRRDEDSLVIVRVGKIHMA